MELLGAEPGEASASIRARVEAARDRQRARLAGTQWTCNAQVPGVALREDGQVSAEAEELLASAVERFALSGRGFDRAIRVARTIADLEDSPRVERGHVSEALGYRAPLLGEVASVG
jgi:magnesium chelatase family protein